MSTWIHYPRVTDVQALPGHQLLVTFDNEQQRHYDFKRLLERPVFALLKSEALFKTVRVEVGGVAIVWNDELDLAESELWLNGTPVTDAILAPA